MVRARKMSVGHSGPMSGAGEGAGHRDWTCGLSLAALRSKRGCQPAVDKETVPEVAEGQGEPGVWLPPLGREERPVSSTVGAEKGWWASCFGRKGPA